MGHGNWLAWVEATLSFGSRQAQKYMRLAENANALPNANCGSHLGINEALALFAEPRETQTAPLGDRPQTVAQAPGARAVTPAPRPQIRSAPDAEADHLARLQDALGTIMALPEPAVLANVIGRRRVDTLRPVVRVSQYLNRLGIELDRRR